MQSRLASLTSLFAATALLLTLAPANGSVATSPENKTLKPAQVASSIDVPNSQRGQYRWMGYEPRPADWVANDVYYRDQIYWGRIEPQNNEWNFAHIEAGLADARTRGGKFSFRVMAYCPGCWMESRPDFPPVTPPFVETQANSTIPAWNSNSFLTQWEELMGELSRRYANDPALGTIDVGGYGAYGEWHVFEGEKITDPNGQRVVKAVTNAFPKKWVLLNSMTSVEFFQKALKSNPNLGVRTDNLGCENMYSMVAVTPELQSWWKTRPFHTEWCTRADPILGAKQVRQFHISTMSSSNMPWTYEELGLKQQTAYRKALVSSGYRYSLKSITMPRQLKAGKVYRMKFVVANQGTAPTYKKWKTELLLTDAKGTSYVRNVRIPLQKILPGRKTFTRTVSLRGVRKGKYVLSFQAFDPEFYLPPMNLANKGRDDEGAYRLGKLTVR